MRMKGARKVAFGAYALAILSGGYALCAFRPEAHVSFGAFATAVVSILTAVVIGNVGEHVAQRGAQEPKA
jgi:hypothetical protein